LASGLIGSIGHFSVLYASLALGLVFWLSQAVATVVAMVFNFAINNVLTYHDDRLRGVAFYKGLLLYSIIASVGIVANVSTAQITYQRFEGQTSWRPRWASSSTSCGGSSCRID
jgi:Predicted membrane protein